MDIQKILKECLNAGGNVELATHPERVIPPKISGAFENTSPWDESMWARTSGDYGSMEIHDPVETTHRLKTPKWFISDHPHWNNKVKSDYKNMKSTYMDLGSFY